MPEEELIRQLLQEMIVSDRPLEEVCRDHPEVAAEVRKQWERVRVVQEQIDALFPSSESSRAVAGSSAFERELPQIPGYDIQAILGYGGMGVVYKAQHLALNRPVALKMLLAGVFASAPERQRLVREAQAVAVLRHPNIVTIFDVGECEGRPFFTMELVEGQNLAQRLAGTPQTAKSTASIVATLADAVHSAHQAGIVHRDLKPANVLVTIDGTPKITDFGLARHFEGDAPLTLTGLQVGTPSYMAPEQASGRADALGPGVDIYSLGALLYEMLTGRPPFRAETALETQRQVIEDEPAPPSRLNSKVPHDLETICLKCLEKDSRRRYTTAKELAEDLMRFDRGEPIAARRIGPLGRVLKWCRRRPAHALLMAGISAAAIAVLIAAIWCSGRQADTEHAIERDLTELAQRQRDSDWLGARTALERAMARDSASPATRKSINQAQRDLDLVEQLHKIRLRRAVIVDFRFDRQANNHQADRAYAAAFSAARMGDPRTSAARVAGKIRTSAVRAALLGALDDWAACTADDTRRAWIMDVAKLVDVGSTPWRVAARDPIVWSDRPEIVNLMQSATVDSESVHLLTVLAERARTCGADPIPFLRRVQTAHPGDFWANTALGDALASNREFGEAVRFYQSALSVCPDDAIAYNNLAVALAQDARIDEAVNQLGTALRINPEFAAARSSLGLCLKLKNRFVEALDQQIEAARLDPESAAAHSNLGIALEDVGRLDEAIAEFRAAIRIDPKNAGAHLNLGRTLARTGHLIEAVDTHKRAVQLAPNDAFSHVSLGRTLTQAHRFDEALDAFTTAVRLQPGSADCHADRGVTLTKLGRLDDAVESYRKALALDPGTSESIEYLRESLCRENRANDVCDVWQIALAANPSRFDARDGYAVLCLFLGRLDEYRRECTVLINRFGSSADTSTAERIAEVCLLAPVSDADAACVAAIVDRARPEAMFIRALLEYRRNRLGAAMPLLQQALASETSARAVNASYFILALTTHRRGDDRLARKILSDTIPRLDWRPASGSGLTGWTWHILRREAESAIIPNWRAFLEGTWRPEDNDERLALIGVCESRDLHHLTAGLYDDAFDADPALAENRENNYRYNATCYAMMVVGNDGRNAVQLSDKVRTRWRDKAKQWLRDELASWKSAASGSAQQRSVAYQRLRSWQMDADLAGLRDPDRLAELSEQERDECRALWAEVDSVLQALQDPK